MPRRRLLDSIFTLDETQQKIQDFINIIEQDSFEKVNQIEIVTESEYKSELYKHMKGNIVRIEAYYDKQEEKYMKSLDREVSVMKNNAYCKVLSARSKKIEELISIARTRITKTVSDDPTMYKKLINSLLIQGILKILEPEVSLRIRKEDEKLINSLLNEAKTFYKNKTGQAIDITVNDKFLDDKHIGGIIITTPKNHIYLENTLESRLRIVVEELMPQLRYLMFGSNSSRKFFN